MTIGRSPEAALCGHCPSEPMRPMSPSVRPFRRPSLQIVPPWAGPPHPTTRYSPSPRGPVATFRSAVAGPDVEFHLHEGAGHAFDNHESEIFYDEVGGHYLIFWASTIPGRFAETEESGDLRQDDEHAVERGVQPDRRPQRVAPNIEKPQGIGDRYPRPRSDRDKAERFGRRAALDPDDMGDREGLGIVDVDLGMVKHVRDKLPLLKNRRADIYRKYDSNLK